MTEQIEQTAAAQMSKAAMLRTMLTRPKPIRAVGAHDGLSAKLVEQAGFDAVWSSSFAISASFGLPDASLITMSQFLAGAEAMDLAVGIPVIADCDTGFGGPANVAYTVQRYERAGIAAISIEDKIFPKLNSFADAPQDLLSVEEFVLKIKEGKKAQRSEDFMLIARTEALIAGLGVSEALDRAHAYVEAGADAILVHSRSKRPDEVLEFAAKWDCAVPLVSVPTTYSTVDEITLFEAGYRVVIYANHGLRAAVRGMRETLRELSRAGRAAAVDDRIASMGEVFDLQGMRASYLEKS